MTDFVKLYNTYFNDVYLYIRRLSGDEHIAEEITSETFFKAMHSIDSFRGDCDVRVWLCQIAKIATIPISKGPGRSRRRILMQCRTFLTLRLAWRSS